MGPDLTEAGRVARCPSCGAALRPDAPWCTLCYADLRPQPEAPPPAPPPVVVDPLTAPLTAFPAVPGLPLQDQVPAAPGDPTWPCSVCGAANPLGSDTCAGCGAGFLAALREEVPALVIPGLGDVGRLERTQRYALAAFVVVAFIGITVLLGLL